MRAAVITSQGFRWEEQAIPTPSSDEVVVRSLSCGICEGETYRYSQLQGSDSVDRLFLGHEGSGIVHAVGSAVTAWCIGDVVTTSLGGTYSDYFVVNQDRLVRLPAGISPLWAVGEAVACCAYSAKNARIERGNKVVVLGCGFMGLLCAAFAKKLYGAAEVDVVDPIAWRLELAGGYGVDRRVATADELPDDYYDVVIEAAGVAAALDSASRLVAQHGRLTIVGYHQSNGGMRNVQMQCWNYKALEITSGHCRKPEWKRAALQEVLPLIADGRVNLPALVTPYPFAEIDQAYRDILARKQGLMKAAVIFE